MQELDIQRELIKATIVQGGEAFKMSNRFLVGVPDLFVQLPNHPTALIEVKYEQRKKMDGIVHVCLTGPQQNRIRLIQKAGGVAGWVLVVRVGLGRYLWHASRIIGSDWPVEMRIMQERQHGRLWPMATIVDAISSPLVA